MRSLYFAVKRKAVLNYFNPFKTEQFIVNFFTTVQSLHDHDPQPRKCLRSIYLVLSFQSIVQLYLYLFPFPWHRLIFFDMLEESNNYPSLFKVNISAVFLMTIYIFYMLYINFSSTLYFKLMNEYYIHDAKTFIKTPCREIKKLAIAILNVYQLCPITAGLYILRNCQWITLYLSTSLVVYLCFEYLIFTHRIFRSHSLLAWIQCIEFAGMTIFFVTFASALFLFVFISYACITSAVLGVSFLVYRFRETHEPLSRPYSRYTTLRLLRFVHNNIGTMQYIFSLNQIFGPILLAFLVVNLPWNVMIAILFLQNRFSSVQMLVMLVVYVGQLTCFLCVHLAAAGFSKKIHSPYKRIMSLNILIQQCPLRARIHLASAIQTFHVKKNKYGVTYGSVRWAFGLVTIMSFAKFLLLYGELLMSQYHLMD